MPKPLSCHYALEIVDAPVAEPLSLAEVKTHLHIESTDHDTYIQSLLDAAIAFVDVRGALGKAMITQKWGQWVPPNPGSVNLILGPFQSLTAVKYYDTNGDIQTATLTDFEVIGPASKPIVRPKSGNSWPTAQTRADAIKLEYQIGYGDASTDIPDTIRQALRMLIGHWFLNREAASEVQHAQVPLGFEPLLNIEKQAWYG